MSAQELGSKKWEELFAVQLLITSYIRKCHCKKIAILTLHSVCKHVLGQFRVASSLTTLDKTESAISS